VSAAQAVRTVADVLETDEARVLLETAKESGSVSAEEIALALDELDLDAGQIEDFYRTLEELQVLYRRDGAAFEQFAGAIVGDEEFGCDVVQDAFA